MHNPYYKTLQNLAFISGIAGVLLISITMTSTGCTYPEASHETSVPVTPVVEQVEQDALDKSIEAHGGIDRWRSFGSLEFTFGRGDRVEQHHIDLHSRRTLITTDEYQIGYDGSDVWITPGLDAFSGSPRFMNGLHFYFFAIPFVLSDPGTNREYLGRVRINDQEYEAVKISYNDGVGASSDDYYIVHLDPETYEMSVLLYTATFRTQTPSENYNARVYEEWQEVDGLLLPKKIVSYRWDAEGRRLGDKRGEAFYSDIKLSKTSPEAALFAPPPDAEIDTPE
ncbi:MAG: hypothetical protein KTR29_16400 [Rhodothermaceae bacterium]|nr:hypothetical protein [Rhodothermaceae bacterium]